MCKSTPLILLLFLSFFFNGAVSAAETAERAPQLQPTTASQTLPIAPQLPEALASNAPALPRLTPATTYFPILPFEAGDDAVPQIIPLASNIPLEGDHKGLRHVILVIHDYTRDAGAALSLLNSLAGADGSNTLIVAPQFLLDIDIARFGDQLPEHGQMFARWPLDAWQSGGDSVVTRQKGISSFTAIDLLLLYLSDKKIFPDVEAVTLLGYGTGGDFVQRYAALGHAPDLLDEQHIPTQFIVANPSSYLYFTAQRPKGGRDGFTTPDVTKCPSYNAYPYGMENLNNYARRVGASAIRLRYITRSMIYLSGDKVSQSDPFPDMSCSALLEGPDRSSRAVNYALYLNIIFGDAIGKLQKFIVVPKTGNDIGALLGSKCGMSALFADGQCR